MKKTLFCTLLAVAGMTVQADIAPAYGQDGLWIRYDNRFLANRKLLDTSGYDSLEFRSSRTMPVVRCYTTSQE